jgi:nucleotide-binding universal stress UspA family protein
MGTHGRTGLLRVLGGSVASTVLDQARCSVLALRAGRHDQTGERIRVILHPTDFSKASEPALNVARSLGREHGARLIVLHVIPFDVHLEGKLAAEVDTRGYQDSLDAIRNRLEGSDLRYPVETRLVRGFEAEQILQESQAFACDLIVMGTHGRKGLDSLLLGSTAKSVLSKAECAVLVVKARPIAPTHTSDQGQPVSHAPG